MSGTQKAQRTPDWNVLTNRWLEIVNRRSEVQVLSPLEALRQSKDIRCIAVANPLDVFAAHRFLLTLLYWKADSEGGVEQLRRMLLTGEMPRTLLDAVEMVESAFYLFDEKAPFLQDVSVRNAKKQELKSAGSLFTEFATGTNIAHFHHGDDDLTRLCPPCATIGMLRIVPWSQSGGRKQTPAIHNAPPILAIAQGENLAATLGLNLVPLPGPPGAVTWAGHFVPTNTGERIPYLEAFTWNPRRVWLGKPNSGGKCWRCGQAGVDVVGPIVYKPNEEVKMKKGKGKKTIPFGWRDPAAFYADDVTCVPIKCRDEAAVVSGINLIRMLDEKGAARPAVLEGNELHEDWRVIIPATNRAKTFDHYHLDLPSLTSAAVKSALPTDARPLPCQGLDGWKEPRQINDMGSAARFVRAAARLLTCADWAVLSAAAYKQMHDSAAAFDVVTGLLWPLRRTNIRPLPRNVAWLVLKLMAAVPPQARVSYQNAGFCPLRSLPKRQLDEPRNDGVVASRYPVTFPRGHRLEFELRETLNKHTRHRNPEAIDWPGFCYRLEKLVD